MDKNKYINKNALKFWIYNKYQTTFVATFGVFLAKRFDIPGLDVTRIKFYPHFGSKYDGKATNTD